MVNDQETSVLRHKLLEQSNLVRYAERLKSEFLEESSSSPSPPLHSFPSSFSGKGKTHPNLTIYVLIFLLYATKLDMSQLCGVNESFWCSGSKTKSKPKAEKSEEEKKFKKRARFFLAAQFLAVVIYVSVMGGVSSDEVEYEDDD